MKIPQARKLPSGAWNIRVQANGKTHSITKPTEKECVAEAAAIKAGLKDARLNPSRKTLTKAIDDYIESRQNVLSPSTIRGYRVIQKNRFQQYILRDISKLTQEQWQRAVNQEAKLCSAKTLKNAWGFVSSVIEETTDRRYSVRLPQVVANDLPFLTAEQIPVFLEALKGEHCEIGALLALSSLRRSEIFALRWSDIDLDNGCIYVHGAAVHDENGKLIQRKENKNKSSRRTIPFILPQLRQAVEIADKKSEYVFTNGEHYLQRNINRICKKSGLPNVGVHGLRRSFASLAYHLGISEEVAMRTGGWSDYTTMRKIYTKVSQKDIQDQANIYTAFFETAAKTGTETGTE